MVGWKNAIRALPTTLHSPSVPRRQLAWIATHATLPLRERIETTLKLGPQPHPYRRIRRGKEGNMILAVQDWRIDFRVEGESIEVLGLRSGYRPLQLKESSAADAALDVHRQFRARFT